MSAIVTQFVEDHKLRSGMGPDDLSQHAPKLLELLTDRVKRVQARQRLRNGYNFNDEQVTALVPIQKGGRSKSGVAPNTPATYGQEVESEGGAVNVCQVSQEETIGEMAQRIVQANLSEMEVKAKCKVLVESASSASSASPDFEENYTSITLQKK